MAFYQLLCGFTVMIILSSKGCHSQRTSCGLALLNTRIVGGQAAPPGAWPWVVSLHDDRGPFCAGSLIADQWVLTAAHCIEGNHSNIKAYVGRQSQSGPNPNEVSREILQAVSHPSFDVLSLDNDIGLLKLSAPVENSDYIHPVCLASAKSTFHSGTNGWVAGWDATADGSLSDILQEVEVPIVGNNECKCAHRGLTENMMCAGLRAGGKDACQGDSGAPLVHKLVFSWVQSGIVSFGTDCGRPMSPGVYTRVSQYEDWIRDVTGSSEPGFNDFSSRGVDGDVNFTCPTSPPATTITTTIATTTRADSTPPPPTPICHKGDGWGKGMGHWGVGSVFDSGENVIHFSLFTHFLSLCVLFLSLFVLVGDA